MPLSFLSTTELPFNLPASQEPARFQFDLKGLVINSFSELPREADGTVSIHAEAEAPRLELDAVRGQVRLDELRLRYKSFELTQQSPATIAIENGRARVDHFLLSGPDTEVSAKGEMQLAGDHAIDLELNAKTNAGILALAAENVTAGGAAELQLAVRGTAAEPELDGSFQLHDGQFALPSPQLQATGLNAGLRFKPGVITLENLSGNLNGGKLDGQRHGRLRGQSDPERQPRPQCRQRLHGFSRWPAHAVQIQHPDCARRRIRSSSAERCRSRKAPTRIRSS